MNWSFLLIRKITASFSMQNCTHLYNIEHRSHGDHYNPSSLRYETITVYYLNHSRTILKLHYYMAECSTNKHCRISIQWFIWISVIQFSFNSTIIFHGFWDSIYVDYIVLIFPTCVNQNSVQSNFQVRSILRAHVNSLS